MRSIKLAVLSVGCLALSISWAAVPSKNLLIDAAKRGDTAAVKAQLKKGINLNAKENDKGATALIVASIFGHVDVVQTLLEKGADIDAHRKDGGTALILASIYGNYDVVKALLAKGADVNAKANNGATALIMASDKNHLAIVNALINKGANVNAKENNGATALMMASSHGYLM